MTTVTVTVTRPRPATEGAGFGRLLYAEWTKFVTGHRHDSLRAADRRVRDLGRARTHGQPCGQILPNGETVSGPCASPPLGPGGELVTDSFYLVRQPLPGDGTVTARVTSLAGSATPGIAGGTSALQPWAKAGIIIKVR